MACRSVEPLDFRARPPRLRLIAIRHAIIVLVIGVDEQNQRVRREGSARSGNVQRGGQDHQPLRPTPRVCR